MRLMQALKRMRYLALLLPGTGFFALAGTNEAQAAITYQSAGAVAYSAAGGTTVAPAYPASIAVGDLLVLIVGMKPSTANSGSVTTPAGWIAITSLTGAGGYGGTLGADTGNTNVFTFYKVAVGGETGTLTVTLATNNVSWAQMYRLSNATSGWDVAGTTGSDATGGAAVSIAMSANPGVTSGDYILGAMVIPTDVSTPGQFSGEGLSQTGITFGAVTEISEPDSGNGNDIGGFTYRAPVSSGTASAAPTLTATAGGTTTNVRGPGVFIRAREVSYAPGPGRYAVASGNWDATTTWSSSCAGAPGASIPVAGADVTICSGFTVTLNTNTASLNSLTVQSGGTLRFGNNNTARILTVAGNISNAGTLNVNAASNTTHSLIIGGDIANSGTFNLATDAGSLCNTTFNRNGSQAVSGAGATTRFNRMMLNMGTTNANILDITATNFSINPAAPTNFLTLTNGTFKFSTAGTITPFTAAPTISTTQGFWLNNASATVNNGDFDWIITGSSDTARGLLRVSAGTLNLTASENSDLYTGNFSDILIEGGAVNVGGALRPVVVDNNVRFNMSAGTLTVAAGGGQPGTDPFRMEAAASFTMSGGTIVVREPAGGDAGYWNQATTNNVTGGTLQIGDGSTPGGSTIEINSTAPVGNLLINSTNATGLLMTNSLTVNGNVTITAGTLDANNLNITLGGNWSRTGTFTPGTGTVTFNGTSAQGITGATAFYNLVINNATGVTANSNATINGNFTNTAGFNAGTTTTTFSGTALQTLTGTTTFYDLVFNNAAGFTLNNDMTASNALTLTSGVIATGTANSLIFSSTSTCAVTRTSGRVNGWLRKRFTASQTTCDFEIGNATNYTPVNVSFTAVSAAGTVTAKATSGVHPEISTSSLDYSTPNLVNRYWMLTPGDGLTHSDTTLTFTPIGGSPVDHDNLGNVGSYRTQRYEISGGACDPADGGYTGVGSWNSTNESCATCLAQTTTRIMTGDISTFGSICSHFAIGVGAISNFLREREFIYQRELYY